MEAKLQSTDEDRLKYYTEMMKIERECMDSAMNTFQASLKVFRALQKSAQEVCGKLGHDFTEDDFGTECVHCALLRDDEPDFDLY